MSEWAPSGVQRKAVPLVLEKRRNQRSLPGGSDTGELFSPRMQLLALYPLSPAGGSRTRDVSWLLVLPTSLPLRAQVQRIEKVRPPDMARLLGAPSHPLWST